MRVSIFTPKAFSIRSAISPERSALPLSRLGRGAGNMKRGRRRYREARRLDNLRPNEISGTGRVLHTHGVYSFYPSGSLPNSGRRFLSSAREPGSLWEWTLHRFRQLAMLSPGSGYPIWLKASYRSTDLIDLQEGLADALWQALPD